MAQVKPIIAVVGRPNVGKSTFFNKMVGARVSIVEDTPGVTRDRVYADSSWQNYEFTLVDTGGIDPYSDDPLLQQMRRQAEIAVDTADVILFFVDGKDGLTGPDYEVADLLRRTKKPVLLVVNKIDTPLRENDKAEFYALGMGEPHAISSVNLLGIGDLLEEMCKYLPDPDPDAEQEEGGPIKIAVVGRPNVGKSSLVNRILKEDRVMVSDIAGTTRDAIDTAFTDEGDDFVIIDTAGIRKRSKIEDASLERYSVIRSLAAIRRCDVALLLIDAAEGVTEQDAHIASVEKGTGTLEKYTQKVRADLKFLDYAPVLYISAKTGQRVDRVLKSVREAHRNASSRVTTGVLNDALHDAMAVTPPPSENGRRLRIYYATQQKTNPPTFILFVNDRELLHFSYERYLENHLRKTFPFAGTPIRILARERNEKEEK